MLWEILCYGGCPVHPRLSQHPWPLPGRPQCLSSPPPPHEVWWQNLLQTLPRVPWGTKTSSAPLVARRFYVHGVFSENTWQERLWAMHWGCDSEEGKCSSVFMEPRSGGEGKSPGCGVTLEPVLCLGPGRSQGSPGPITLRTGKPWKDPITSQYIVLSWPVGPSDKWGQWALPLGDRELLQHRLMRRWRNEELSIKWAPEQNKRILSAYKAYTSGVTIWACLFSCWLPYWWIECRRVSQTWCLEFPFLALDFLL